MLEQTLCLTLHLVFSTDRCRGKRWLRIHSISSVLNHLYKTCWSLKQLREPRRCGFLHIPASSFLSAVSGCPSRDRSWKALETQLLLCLAAHPGAWRTPGQTQERNPSQPWNEEPGVDAADSLDSLKQGTTAIPGCSAVGSTGRSYQDSYHILSRYFEY